MLAFIVWIDCASRAAVIFNEIAIVTGFAVIEFAVAAISLGALTVRLAAFVTRLCALACVTSIIFAIQADFAELMRRIEFAIATERPLLAFCRASFIRAIAVIFAVIAVFAMLGIDVAVAAERREMAVFGATFTAVRFESVITRGLGIAILSGIDVAVAALGIGIFGGWFVRILWVFGGRGIVGILALRWVAIDRRLAVVAASGNAKRASTDKC